MEKDKTSIRLSYFTRHSAIRQRAEQKEQYKQDETTILIFTISHLMRCGDDLLSVLAVLQLPALSHWHECVFGSSSIILPFHSTLHNTTQVSNICYALTCS